MPAAAVNPSHQNHIPAAVRRQAEAAEAAQRTALGIVEAPAAAAPEGATPAPAPAQAPAPVPAAPPIQSEAEQELARERGRTAAERERNGQLTNEVNQLRADFARLQQQLDARPAPQPERFVTPEEEANYGSELVEVMGKKAKETFQPIINSLQDEIRQLKDQLGRVGSRVDAQAENDIYAQLNKEVPEWNALNEDDAFLNWLRENDPFSGIKRFDLLDRAFKLKNAANVIAFFKGYLKEAAATGQLIRTPNNAPPISDPASSPLAQYAAPGRATPGTAVTPPSGDKPVYTQSQIDTLYRDRAHGKWRGRDSEWAQVERDIFLAPIEGRVVG